MNKFESLLRGYLAAGDAGDLKTLDRYLHPDVVLHEPDGQTVRGIAHERESWRTALTAILVLNHHVKQVVAGDSSVAAHIVISGTLIKKFAGVEPPGRTFSTDQAFFLHIRDGKADEIWTIVDTGSFLRQVSFPKE